MNKSELIKVVAVIDEMVEHVLDRFENRIAGLKGSLEDIIERNKRGAQDGRKGNDELFDLALDPYNAGMLATNLAFILTGCANDKVSRTIAFIAIRRAMARNQQLDCWIRSLVAGAKVCDSIKMMSRKFKPDDYQVNQGTALETAISD